MNLSVRKCIKSFFDRFFWRQHPEAALRYLPAVAEIKKRKLENSKVLEVGSGSLGITPYLKRNIDGLDIDFSGPQSKMLNKFRGTAINVPFRRSSYDTVLSIDVLEHLKKDDRKLAIFEQLRVAKKLAIIVVPVGRESEEQDKNLDEIWRRVFGEKHENQFLSEHIQNGLPTTSEILVAIDKSARLLKKEYKVSSRPLLNLKVRKILMKTWITKNIFIYYLYMKGFLLLLPLLKLANFGNCYRKLFVIELAP